MVHLSPRHGWSLCLLLLAGSLASCTILSKRTAPPTTQELNTTSQGYTLLYELVSQQEHTDELLLIKLESDAVDTLISDIAAYSTTLEDRLIELAKADPRLDLERQIMPEMASKTQQSIQAEQIKELLGATGKEFERLLLWNISGTLNQARHLARVMREAEPSEERKAFWNDVQEHFDDLYQKVMELLERRYFS